MERWGDSKRDRDQLDRWITREDERMSDHEQSYWNVVSKINWGNGPWNDEPDKLQWIDQASGLDCLIVRGPLGALCGYVGVPPGHSSHGHDYGELLDILVHGGLTYSGACSEGPENRSICHIPAPGRPADVWWFGFDCAHFTDRSPRMDSSLPLDELHTYRTVDYVREECTNLASQLATLRS